MSEQRLRAMLRETPVPGAEDAERRGRRVVEGAFAQRQPVPHRPSPRRLALALAIATLLTALLLSPAGAAVRDWIDDVLTVGVRDAEPALTEIPGGGRLLVSSPQGSWAVKPDGSRRLLGSYSGAVWSPRGLYVGAIAGRTLSAVEPDGTVRWSLSATGPVRDPRWSPVPGVRIAYRAGREMRVVAGDGTGDRQLDRNVAPVAPAWAPLGPYLLAYIRGDGSLRIVNVDSEQVVGASDEASVATRELAWAPDGSHLLEVEPRSLRLRDLRIGKLANEIGVGPARSLALPLGAVVQSAAFSPHDGTIATLLHLPGAGARPPHSAIVLIDPASGSRRPLFTASGRLADLFWSPDGSRLLTSWRDANQWLFIPTSGRDRVRAIGGISAEFSPGAEPSPAGFPRIDGWCCAATTNGQDR